MKTFNYLIVYSVLLLSIGAGLSSAADAESTTVSQPAAESQATTESQVAAESQTTSDDKKTGILEKGLSRIGNAATAGANLVNKATENVASQVNEVKNPPTPNVHGEGKLIPSAINGARRLFSNAFNNLANVAKAAATSAKETGKAVRETAKHSLRRLVPKWLKENETNQTSTSN